MLSFKGYLDTIILNKQTHGNAHCCVLSGVLHGLLFEHVVPVHGAVWKFGESMGGRASGPSPCFLGFLTAGPHEEMASCCHTMLFLPQRNCEPKQTRFSYSCFGHNRKEMNTFTNLFHPLKPTSRILN